MKVDANRTCSPTAFQGLRRYQTVKLPDGLQITPPKKKVQKGPLVALGTVILLITNILIYQCNKEKMFMHQLEHLLEQLETEYPQDSTAVVKDELPPNTIMMDEQIKNTLYDIQLERFEKYNGETNESPTDKPKINTVM